ncbi:MAG: hypothetical protein LBN39_06195, partial [Planctomycetaceae bacterium]|nr:hypothetical protein [Planctomycetaceae bacterium]
AGLAGVVSIFGIECSVRAFRIFADVSLFAVAGSVFAYEFAVAVRTFEGDESHWKRLLEFGVRLLYNRITIFRKISKITFLEHYPLFLQRRIKKYGWSKNVLTTLMVFPHTLFPLLVLQEFIHLPFWLQLLSEHALWGGIILWVMCLIIYLFWLEYHYQKTFRSN